jgi:hypothetical protein
MTTNAHEEAVKLHIAAAEAHKAAAEAHTRGDKHAAQNLTTKAHECSSCACKHTAEIAKKAPQPVKV